MIDWQAFKRGEFAVRCDTEEKARAFLAECDARCIRWGSGEKIRPNIETYWLIYRENTCYFRRCGELYYGTSFGNICTDYDPIADVNKKPDYTANILETMKKQKEKGISKYGVTLEENTTLSTVQRLEHMEEELIDALQYIEHAKESMKDKLTLNDYQRMALRTAGDDESKYTLNGTMGMCGEAGECIDIVKKHLFQGHELDREKLIMEMGDTMWYISQAAKGLGVTLEEVAQQNIDKLKKRYPGGSDKARSINRAEGAE